MHTGVQRNGFEMKLSKTRVIIFSLIVLLYIIFSVYGKLISVAFFPAIAGENLAFRI